MKKLSRKQKDELNYLLQSLAYWKNAPPYDPFANPGATQDERVYVNDLDRAVTIADIEARIEKITG